MNFSNLRAGTQKTIKVIRNVTATKIIGTSWRRLDSSMQVKIVCVVIAYSNECYPISSHHSPWNMMCLTPWGKHERLLAGKDKCSEGWGIWADQKPPSGYTSMCSAWRVGISGLGDKTSIPALMMDMKKSLASQICHHPSSLLMAWALIWDSTFITPQTFIPNLLGPNHGGMHTNG